MIEKITNSLKIIYKLKNKIAFYPSLIGLLGCLIAYVMLYLEKLGMTTYLLKIIPNFVVNNTETARALLTTSIGGLISIMVFSFSMVMILLSQASSNFSPRLLPGLISNRRHQIILGIYLATIIYCIFILVYIEPNSNKYQLPGSSILVAIFFMLNCLAAFIYFIHSISQEIQINNIMDKIFKISETRLKALIENEDDEDKDLKINENWVNYTSRKTGYLQNVSLYKIAEIALKENFKIHITPTKGTFILDDMHLFKTSKKVEDNTLERLFTFFEFGKGERIEDNYVLAFKQLTEIALKAMSPGINDPGTALIAIDYLTKLFIIRVDKSENLNVVLLEDVQASMSTITFKDLLYQVMVGLRTYCKHDVIMIKKLLSMLKKIDNACNNLSYKNSIAEEIKQVKLDAKSSIKNERDLALIKY